MSTAQAPILNMDKLNAFVGQFVTDLGASVHAGMVVIGENLGSTRLSPLTQWTRRNWPPRRRPMSAMCASGWLRKPPAATSPTTNNRQIQPEQEQAFTLGE